MSKKRFWRPSWRVDMPLVACPHCGFAKDVDPTQLPAGTNRAKCPKCGRGFPLRLAQPEAAHPPAPRASDHSVKPEPAAADRPKAGFWMRLVATLVDAAIVFALQFVLGTALAAAGVASSGANTETFGAMAVLVQIFGYTISLTYYIVFTGHCGQTPGKMALRIKVIRCDGSNLGYGRAAFREVPAKFLSGILLGIGYLMVAFDEQKQGLHDRMADTYVIKL